MLFKKSFSSYLKGLFIVSELIFLFVAFILIFSYVRDKEEKQFREDATLSTNLVETYVGGRLKLNTEKALLNSYLDGKLDDEEFLNRVDFLNIQEKKYSSTVHIYLGPSEFYPPLNKDLRGKVNFQELYNKKSINTQNGLYVLSNFIRDNKTILKVYNISNDEILKKNINATDLDGYIYKYKGKSELWLSPQSHILEENLLEPIPLDSYKLALTPSMVNLYNQLKNREFLYIRSDIHYVETVRREIAFILSIFILKFIFTLVFTLLTTKAFSISLNRLVNDSKKLAVNGHNRSIRGKNYRFKEFQSLANVFSVIIDMRNSTEEKLRLSSLNMEETVKKRTAELSQAIEKAENASKAKMNFLAQISHEIRTPMNCIIGFCEIIMNKSDPGSNSDYAKKIIDESDTLLKLINDILDDSKMESGKMTLEVNSVHISTLVTKIIDLGNPYESSSSIDIRSSIAASVPKYIGIDELRLYQIISNIYFNALKYTPSGSVSLDIESLDNTIVISVTDTGIGIPGNRIETIFDDFERLDGSLATRYKGTGLGLTITKKIVDYMGGEIFVESTPGKGSCFRVKLPFQTVNKGAEQKSVNREFIELTLDKGDVLLVEDYPTNRIIAKNHLESVGHRVFEAENGEVAVELCKERKFDLILMDIQMPVLDGFSATQRIREGAGINSNTPIIAMTANGLKSIEKRCQEAGMNGILLKPIRRVGFLEYIDSVLKGVAVV